ARESALAIESNILMGFEVVALVEISELERMVTEEETVSVRDEIHCIDRKFKLMRLGGDLKARLRALGRPYVVLALDADDYTVHSALLEELAASQNNMSIIPPLRGLPLMGTEISPIFRHEVMHLRIRNNLANRIPRFIKRGFDIVLSGLGLLALSPLFVYLIIKVGQDGGPAFYSQRRIGRNGRIFKCWKFRSMHVNAEKKLQELLRDNPEARAEYERTQKLKDDPRITKLGHFIRATSIDELPQLWNVFTGDMSLVGPRPVRPDELSLYGAQSRYYLQTRPGITGLWQISGRNDVEYHTRVSLDAWYVRNWSLWYDITILFKTVRVVLHSNGAY
ncbi:exopolysaccharide biosynthesis polyprenyl glycosylphosphotransferase, partial [Granulosicoccaceae sp. 1_MG-2023]|nr:exopolysaccharide biosynthesis polyprenyl glycosylphosphotransferase [Granulosicoccaceae sp. 1_MG-2023]